jgi:hypothetical protein
MKIQPRDRRLLSNLNRYGVLSTRQIRNIFFAGIAHSTVMRRLRKLEKKNLIGRVSGLEEGLCAWQLGAKGVSLLGVDTGFRYANRNTIEHEVKLSSLRIAPESVGLGADWVNDGVQFD